MAGISSHGLGTTQAGGAVQPPTQAGGSFLQTFSSLRHPNYRYHWSGTVLMSAGQWIQELTLGWLAYNLTGSAVVLGALNGLRALPYLLTSPIAGVVADRMDRRKLLMLTQPGLVVTALILAALVLTGVVEVWHLFVLTLASACFWSFSQPVRQSIVPSTVPRQDLMNAIALNSAGFNLTKVLGPAIGGVLIVWVGAGGNFLLQAVVFALVWVTLFKLKIPPHAAGLARKASMYANLKEGLRYVWKDRLVLALITAALVPQVLAMPYQALLPVFQKDVLGVGPEVLGLMLGAPGIGAMFSTVGLASLGHRVRRKGLLILGSLLAMGCALLVFATTTVVAVGLLALVAVGFSQVLFNATTNTMLQTLAPEELRGRVMSIYMLDVGLRPAGALLAGVATHFVGAPATVVAMGGLVILVAAVLAWRVPHLRTLES